MWLALLAGGRVLLEPKNTSAVSVQAPMAKFCRILEHLILHILKVLFWENSRSHPLDILSYKCLV